MTLRLARACYLASHLSSGDLLFLTFLLCGDLEPLPGLFKIFLIGSFSADIYSLTFSTLISLRSVFISSRIGSVIILDGS